ncbi:MULTISPECIES: CotH kinase family protein [unclassified Ruminococcus]|uniref:CotH kinase family protein n=1 Tax=unclassified Ruminococcus TaxID=2608920 RepID=UPI00210BBD8E|nr:MULTISPECIES: CotH kinase family protein [unclassified Ruminococcus]MCQ4021779.1 starch-binding protein [Ruminococcus sp. zg-924]MCQ4114223.1 starch-binding protein [Ruminococcus sp. zg-921]
MKRFCLTKKLTALFLCLLMAVLPFTGAVALEGDEVALGVPSYIQSSTDKAVWLDGCSADGVSEIDAVKWFLDKDGVYYFFMPTSADVQSAVIYHNFDSVSISGKAVASGDTLTDLPINQKFTVTADGNDYTAFIMKSSGIASMFLTTESGNMDAINNDKTHETAQAGQLLLVDSEGAVSYDGELNSIKGRGNTTWRLDKKPYNIKLPKKASLLGMKSSKKWCLLANAQEHSMIRNRVAYDLAHEVGLDFSPESHFLDLYANGEYLGTYQLTEKVELGKNNLVSITDLQGNTEEALLAAGENDDIESYSLKTAQNRRRQGYSVPVNPSDITGGYLLEYVVSPEEPCHFITTRGQAVDLKTVNSIEQVGYIADFVQDMEDALYSETGYNSKGKHYTDYVDIESAALMYLLDELAVNIDSGISSCYFYKDSDTNGDGKLHAAPVWDYDVAFGNLASNKDGVNMTSTNQIFAGIAKRYNTDYYTVIAQFAQHSDFMEKAGELWKTRYAPAFDILNGYTTAQGRLKSFDEYSKLVSDASKMNYTRWDVTTNLLVPSGGTTHTEQLRYYLDWISKREGFMSNFFTDLQTAQKNALASLESYKNSFIKSDYEAEAWDSFLAEYQKGIDNINAATTNTEVGTALNEAKTAMRTALGNFYVYFDNSKTQWDKVYIYWWSAPEAGTLSWPGVLMTDCGNGVWKYKLDQSVVNILFDNGNNGEQSKDLTFGEKPNQIWVPDINNANTDNPYKTVFSGEWKDYITKGDVNGDGKINLFDSITVQKAALQMLNLDEQATAKADVNGDGNITVYDAIAIQKLALAYIA